MKIAVLGLGGIAQKYYLPILASDPNNHLIIYSRTPQTVAQTKANFRIQFTAESVDDILSWRPDAAFVLTPSHTHHELVKILLTHGVDVFAEKPVTLSPGETRELAELADASQRILMVGFNRRYAPLHQRAREYWGNRKVEQAVFTKLRTHPFHDAARAHMYDDTIHLVDALRFYCGEGRVVHREIRSDGYFTSATALIALDDGGIAQVVTTMRAGQWREHYLLAGDGLTLEVDAFQRLRISQGDEQRNWREDYDSGKDTFTGRGFKPEIDYFLDCVNTRAQPLTSAWDSLRTQMLLEEILKDD